jgi:hypothetical protein
MIRLSPENRHFWLLTAGVAVLSLAVAGVFSGIEPRVLISPAASLVGLLIVIMRTLPGTMREDAKLAACGMVLFSMLFAVFFLLPLLRISQPVAGASTPKPRNTPKASPMPKKSPQGGKK